MTSDKLKVLVTRAVVLDRSIARDQEELKALKEQLATEAESRSEDSTPTEGGGTSLVFEGADGSIARVTTAGATLKSSVKAEGRDIEKVKTAAGRHFSRLFETVLAYKPIASFRDETIALLGAKDGGKLIKLCETKGKTTVSFETKEVSAAE
jgi:hypothetical protein